MTSPSNCHRQTRIVFSTSSRAKISSPSGTAALSVEETQRSLQRLSQLYRERPCLRAGLFSWAPPTPRGENDQTTAKRVIVGCVDLDGSDLAATMKASIGWAMQINRYKIRLEYFNDDGLEGYSVDVPAIPAAITWGRTQYGSCTVCL